MPNTPPPSTNALRKFLLGELPPTELDAVGEWVAENPLAVETLAGIDATDSLVTALAEPAPDISCPASVVDAAVHTVVQLSPPPAASEPTVGDEIEGFRLESEIGRGGMGVVFKAWHVKLNRWVAVKFVAGRFVADPKVRDRFLHEARAMAAVDHENVVPIWQIGTNPDRPFMVMPLLKGETLASRLRREKRLPPAEVRRIGREVAAGLAALHAARSVHRDIKPENIWIEAGTGRVVVLDFGLAKPVEASDDRSVTRDGAIIGSPHYMSPEQAQGQALDARTDLFSLGAVLYECATGKRPFTGDSAVAILAAVLKETSPDPETVNPALPPRLAGVIRSLLEKNPDARPATAAEVISLLAEPTPKLRRRLSPAWWATIAGLLLAFAAVAVYQIEFKTRDGTLIVEVSGDADVRFRNGELHIYDTDGKLKYTLKPGERNAKLPPGQYMVKVVGADGVVLDTPEFTMTKDGQTIRVVTEAGSGPDNPGSRDADRKAAEYVLSVGGFVKVDDDRREIWLPADLPAGPFRLTWVEIHTDFRSREAGLAVMRDCRDIQRLDFGGSQITDAGLAHFRNCTKLEFLLLGRCANITNAGLAHFKACTQLKVFVLTDAAIGGDGLAHLKDCVELRQVALHNSQVTDTGLQTLRHWKNLEVLSLFWVGVGGVGDAGLASLAELKSLWAVELEGSRVTNKGLRHLDGLTKLRNLQMDRTPATPAGLAALAEKLPYCRIQHSNGQEILPARWADRLVAEWALSVGGAVHVNGEEHERQTVGDLPAGSFRLTRVIAPKRPGVRFEVIPSSAGFWGLDGFNRCDDLESIDLRDTDFQDGQTRFLTKCKKLTQLDLRGALVTADGIGIIEKELPRCKIIWNKGVIEPMK